MRLTERQLRRLIREEASNVAQRNDEYKRLIAAGGLAADNAMKAIEEYLKVHQEIAKLNNETGQLKVVTDVTKQGIETGTKEAERWRDFGDDFVRIGNAVFGRNRLRTP